MLLKVTSHFLYAHKGDFSFFVLFKTHIVLFSDFIGYLNDPGDLSPSEGTPRYIGLKFLLKFELIAVSSGTIIILVFNLIKLWMEVV